MSDTICIGIKLRRAAQAIAKLYDQALVPAGITITQFSQMHAIGRLEAPNLGQLARETHLDRSTLGRNIRTLGRLGLIEHGPGADERTRIIRLSEKGKETLRMATPRWQVVQDSLEAELGSKQRSDLFAILSSLEALTSLNETIGGENGPSG
ncbi:MAG: MarR family winged helix-turn-helix transcriptional regulator [Alphaproteobacteria bacterium]|jgi:DNA-binding MarR family transcriptional regulator|nr:MarR family winged helix-turn-helix transcriptional regulator [Alphaproteobacteria bacterium]